MDAYGVQYKTGQRMFRFTLKQAACFKLTQVLKQAITSIHDYIHVGLHIIYPVGQLLNVSVSLPCVTVITPWY